MPRGALRRCHAGLFVGHRIQINSLCMYAKEKFYFFHGCWVLETYGLDTYGFDTYSLGHLWPGHVWV